MDRNLEKKILLFHERANHLKTNDDFRVNLTLSLEHKNEDGTKLIFKGPDTKTVKAYLLDFRPFIANDEPISFYQICSQIYKSSNDSDIRDNCTKARDAWSKLLERKEVRAIGGLRLKVDGKALLSEDNLNTWMNAEYFHLDDKKRELLNTIKSTPLEAFSHFAMLDLLQRLSDIIFWFDKNVIEKVQKI